MTENLIAKASITIDAPREQVWEALVDPQAIRQYMFGTNVVTDWKDGSPIIWQGEWQGKPYQDKGVVLELRPEQFLRYSHFSPLSGAEDAPENYHNVQVELAWEDNQTQVTLTQDKNANEEERLHSEQNWQMMLNSLKEYVEGR